jgi:hypothetical protein
MPPARLAPSDHAQARLARLLWIAFAAVAWNVVFDRVIVLAGRRYVYAGAVAAASGRYLGAADWMRPAAVRGAWIASAAAAFILAIGLGSVPFALRRLRRGVPE